MGVESAPPVCERAAKYEQKMNDLWLKSVKNIKKPRKNCVVLFNIILLYTAERA